jgi:hypothetical protein
VHRLRATFRSSSRLGSLYRGVRGFALGGSATKGSEPIPPIQDRVGQLRRPSLVASPRSAYRLNLVVPTVDGAGTFGGIRTALDLFESVGGDVSERRIVSVARHPPQGGVAVPAYAPVDGGDDPEIPLQLVRASRPSDRLAVRPNDVFVATYWTTAELVRRIRQWQRTTYGSAPERFAYVIQDFEPGFNAFSAEWMLARATYDQPAETIGVYNTSVLRDYFHGTGIRFDQEYSFEPRLLPELRAAMAAPPTVRSRTIVVYGRPGTPRNGFPAIVDGLRAWQAGNADASRWELVSVGRSHPDIDLGGGAVLRSIGKLDLDGYGALLRRASIGISLMISPHPSYPPLEMANLGMLVLTNRFGPKDLATWHSNIRTTDDISAEGLAAALEAMCLALEQDPDLGLRGRALRPEFLSETPAFPFASRLATDLRAGIRDGAPGTGGPFERSESATPR